MDDVYVRSGDQSVPGCETAWRWPLLTQAWIAHLRHALRESTKRHASPVGSANAATVRVSRDRVTVLLFHDLPCRVNPGVAEGIEDLALAVMARDRWCLPYHFENIPVSAPCVSRRSSGNNEADFTEAT